MSVPRSSALALTLVWLSGSRRAKGLIGSANGAYFCIASRPQVSKNGATKRKLDALARLSLLLLAFFEGIRDKSPIKPASQLYAYKL